MAESSNAKRPWEQIASDLSKEYDTKRVIELAQELTEALDEHQQAKERPKAQAQRQL